MDGEGFGDRNLTEKGQEIEGKWIKQGLAHCENRAFELSPEVAITACVWGAKYLSLASNFWGRVEGGAGEGEGEDNGVKKISQGKNVKRKRANARVSVETSFWRYRKDDLDCFIQIH